MKRLVCTFLLGSALLVPVAIRADDDDHHRDRDRRYYDSNARDWHNWNEREERAYRRYLEEQRERDRAWEKANRKQQAHYWKWRHNHPDRDDHDRR